MNGPSDHAQRGEFTDKVALVTGAASGIGRAIALAFARAGAAVAIADRNAAGLEETLRLAQAVASWSTMVDVANEAEVAAMVAGAVQRFGRIDCAVNAAGLSSPVCRSLADFTQAEYDAITDVNAKGVWLCMKHEIKAMLDQGGGAIVNIASGAGVIAVPGNGIYVGSKHAVLGLTKAGAVDYASRGIRINAVCPGFTRTPMAMTAIDAMGIAEQDAGAAAPIGRIGEPDEQADAVLFLCSDRASFMAGHGLVVDGGHSIQ